MENRFYNPKQLLLELREIEETLKTTIDRNCPNPGINIVQDLDKAMDDFLQFYGGDDQDIGLISSQLALLHIQREVERAILVVVDSNNLRAYNDFEIHHSTLAVANRRSKRWNTKEMILGILVGGSVVALMFFVFVML